MIVVEVVNNQLYYTINFVFAFEEVDNNNNYSNCSINEYFLLVLIDLSMSNIRYI